MREQPPLGLVTLLERLKLASAAQVRQVAPRVRRLAGELHDFESVWVDALQQARVLTPLQATEINAGRGESLLCGPYVLSKKLTSPYVAECFSASHIETGRAVRLYYVRRPQTAAADAARQLGRLVEQLAPLHGPVACVALDAGMVGESVWAACPSVAGTTAADWMAENGRLPAHVVLHIARAMLARLADLELLGAVHGDISAAGLVIQPSGHIVLPMPGLRGSVRPSEGYSFNDLSPEAYDYLAPERIAEGDPPSVAGDLYACGCLWWHLLTGRPPFAGGNSLAKLKAVHAARLLDVRQLAPDVPEVLALAMELCLARDPAERPQSSSQVLEVLGPPARGGHAILSRCLAGQAWVWQPASRMRRTNRARHTRKLAVTGVMALACISAVGLWFAQRNGDQQSRPVVVAADAPHERSTAVEPNKLARHSGKNSAERAPRPIDARAEVEPNVRAATAIEAIAEDTAADLVLPGGEMINAKDLRFKSGQRVRGRAGERPLIVISGGGLEVPCEDVRFEGIDFVWEDSAASGGKQDLAPSMVVVAAQSIAMRGCSFSTHSNAAPIAITWRGSPDALPGHDGELVFTDCVFRGVAAVVDCRGATGVAVELSNTLCVAAGPVVRLHDFPKYGRTVAISLDHTTTRGDCAVLDCRYGRSQAEPGPIVISVADSALVTNPRGGLLILGGAQRPEKLLRAISWSGQGSLVTSRTAVALWRQPTGNEQALAEEELAIAGLVRSSVEFAGPADGPPSASRITRWQAPLRSIDPPGANVDVLYLPDE